jgi:hypothetical protein
MDRVLMLRLGYGALGLSFVAFGASVLVGSLVFLAIPLALAGGVLLGLSGDDLPRWSGVALLLYFVVTILVFLAATPITVRLDFFKGFVNDDPSPVATLVLDYLVLALPLMMAATASAAAWEREWPPRLLLAGAILGFVLVTILGMVLKPSGQAELARSSALAQGELLRTLFALSSAAGALGALWAAGRPDEYA